MHAPGGVRAARSYKFRQSHDLNAVAKIILTLASKPSHLNILAEIKKCCWPNRPTSAPPLPSLQSPTASPRSRYPPRLPTLLAHRDRSRILALLLWSGGAVRPPVAMSIIDLTNWSGSLGRFGCLSVIDAALRWSSIEPVGTPKRTREQQGRNVQQKSGIVHPQICLRTQPIPRRLGYHNQTDPLPDDSPSSTGCKNTEVPDQMRRPESDFPTIKHLRDRLTDVIENGLGDLPVQILVVPNSTIEAVARATAGPDYDPKKPGSTLSDAQESQCQIQAIRSELHSERCSRRRFGCLNRRRRACRRAAVVAAWLLVCGPSVVMPTVPPVAAEPMLAPLSRAAGSELPAGPHSAARGRDGG
jgi:hypothetical protein